MGFFSFQNKKLLPILVNRMTIFFFLACIVTLFLYAAGTVQGFVDTTQLFLLRIYTIPGILLCAASILGIILNIVRFLQAKKKRYLFRAGGYLLLVLFGIVTVLTVVFIMALSGGNTG